PSLSRAPFRSRPSCPPSRSSESHRRPRERRRDSAPRQPAAPGPRRAASARIRRLPTTRRRQVQGRSSEPSGLLCAVCAKGATLAYLRLHENRHHFVSNQHALSGQPEATAVMPQVTGVDKRPQVGAEPCPDIDAVAYVYDSQV